MGIELGLYIYCQMGRGRIMFIKRNHYQSLLDAKKKLNAIEKIIKRTEEDNVSIQSKKDTITIGKLIGLDKFIG